MNKENIESPNQELKINSKEIEIGDTILLYRKKIKVKSVDGVRSGDNCVTINKKHTVRKTENVTVISRLRPVESPNVQEGKPVLKWYDYNSLLGYLQGKKWSFKAASEIAQDYADNLQQAFAKGWEKAFNDYKKSGTFDYVYYPKQLAEVQEKNSLQYTRGESETLEQWKIRLDAVLQTDDYKRAYEAIEKQEPSCYGDIALLMLEWQFQHSYTEADKWIKVEDRLPENREWVISASYNEIFLVQYKHGVFWENDQSKVYNITHWQPLPNLPTK